MNIKIIRTENYAAFEIVDEIAGKPLMHIIRSLTFVNSIRRVKL